MFFSFSLSLTLTHRQIEGYATSLMQGEYEEVWQAWSFLKEEKTSDDSPSSLSKASEESKTSALEARRKVQMARVERRLSIHDLAKKCNTDSDSISAYEKGDDVLPLDVYEKVLSVLRI